MGKILKEDFDGKDLKKKMEENPENADYFASYMEDVDCSKLSAKEMLEKAFQLKINVFPYYSKALEIYKKAAGQGNAEAKYRAAEMYERGEGVEQNFIEAVRWYEEAGKSGFLTGWTQAGRIYFHGEEGLPKDCKKAIECFKKAVEYSSEKITGEEILDHYLGGAEDTISYYYLGCLYLNSGGDSTENILEQDYEKAQSHLETAVSHGLYAALECLDYMYETGIIKNSKYKSVTDWYIDKKIDGRAANQLAYIYLSSEDYSSKMIDWHKRILSLLPKESRLLKVLDKKEGGYEKGIFWHEISAEANDKNSFYQLVLHYIYNKENFPAQAGGKNKPPSAEKIEYLTNKFYPINEAARKTNYRNRNCITFIYRIVELAEIARRDGLLVLDSLMEDEKNFFIKTGLLMASDGIDSDIIKTVMENLLEINKKEVEGSELMARKIILQGIIDIQQGENPDLILTKLIDILGTEIESLEKEYAQNNRKTPTDRAWFYYLYGKVYYNQKKWDPSIFYLQKAYKIADKEKDKINYLSLLRSACEEKQNSQTFEERMEPYAQMIEKIKTEGQKPIQEAIKFNTKEELTELAAALALFEEYDLLERLIKEAAEPQLSNLSSIFSDSCSLLNSYVSPQFSYWQPTPLYFITAKKAREKMKDTIKMIKFLAGKGADINLAAGDGSTPLWNQTFDNNPPEILQCLLELGAGPDKISKNGEYEWTPLINCMMPEFIKDDEDFTYHIPITDSQIKKAKMLLDHGADPNLESPCLSGYPPLVTAICYGYPEYYSKHEEEPSKEILGLVEYLIKKGADYNYADSEGNTPLSLAQENELKDIEELLLKHGALLHDEMDAQDDDGRHDGWS